jgi:hypothetical protein
MKLRSVGFDMKTIMNVETEEVVVAYFKVLSLHTIELIEYSHKEAELGYC